jgi:hypothetical protein
MLRIALLVVAAVVLFIVVMAIVGEIIRFALIAAVIVGLFMALGMVRRGRGSRRQDRS